MEIKPPKIKPPKKYVSAGPRTDLVRHIKSQKISIHKKIHGKLFRRALGTTNLDYAKRLAKPLIAEALGQRDGKNDRTLDEIATQLEKQDFRRDADAKPLSPAGHYYYSKRLKALRRFAPEFLNRSAKKITRADIGVVTNVYRTKFSWSNCNGLSCLIRWIFDLAITLEVRPDHPCPKLRIQGVAKKDKKIPEPEEFERLIDAVASVKCPRTRGYLELILFLAYSGCRISEANNLCWRGVSLRNQSITVTGKGNKTRTIPMIPQLLDLLQKLADEKPDRQPEDPVLKEKDATRRLTRACKKIGINKIGHHDLRHFFATSCLEGATPVSIPVLADWLGHADGGITALKTYVHVSKASVAQAKGITIGVPSSAPKTDVSPLPG